jgi:nicotinamidase-related amidase
MPRRAKIVVDLSHDFVANGGRLTCGKPAQDIIPYVVAELDAALASEGTGRTIDDPSPYEQPPIIVIAMDEHKRGKDGNWPPHNDPETGGHRPYGALCDWFDKNKRHPRVIYIPKTKYNAFWGTPLANILRAEGVDTVELFGVCTDICVTDTGAGAYYEGFNVEVHKRGVATFTDGGDAALKLMELKYQAKVIP